MARTRDLKKIIRKQHQDMADSMATTNALLQENEQLREVVESCAGSLERTDLDAPEDAAVRALCERVGYGAVMDAAARLWGRKDDIGAFTVGPCRGTVRSALADREADRQSRMGQWLREPWDDAPSAPTEEKNTENATLREQVAGLREALQFYAEDDNGCAFADYDTETKRFGKLARAALGQE